MPNTKAWSRASVIVISLLFVSGVCYVFFFPKGTALAKVDSPSGGRLMVFQYRNHAESYTTQLEQFSSGCAATSCCDRRRRQEAQILFY
jgi:hypothetical protein